MIESEMKVICAEIIRASRTIPDVLKADLLSTVDEYAPLWWVRIAEQLPQGYDTALACFERAQIRAILSKFQDFPGYTAQDRSDAAWKMWLSVERHNYTTNRRFNSPAWDGPQALPAREAELLHLVRKQARRILGPAPSKSAVFHAGDFGPGVSYESRGSISATIPSKIGMIPTCTPSVIKGGYFDLWLISGWGSSRINGSHWSRDRFESTLPTRPDVFFVRPDGGTLDSQFPDVPLCRGNRWASVPKKWDRDRSIAIEPCFNLFLQKGLGSLMRRRLQRHGLLQVPEKVSSGPLADFHISWESSKEIHGRLARRASLDGSLATIDLSSASDTVAYNVVKAVVPAGWFTHLDAVRSPWLLKDGNNFRLEAFSSMGNGYTFELETVLFSAVCQAVAELHSCPLQTGVNFSVFGDDIIVPSDIASSVIVALKWFGFIPNVEKTFTEGPFRESCGFDYHGGVDVRPMYLDRIPTTPAEWITFHNKVVRRIEPHNFDLAEVLKKHALQRIPRAARLYGPEWLGDVVLHGRSDETWTVRLRPTRDARRHPGVRVPWILTWAPIVTKLRLDRWDPSSAYCAVVYGVDPAGVTPRGDASGYKHQWVQLDCN